MITILLFAAQAMTFSADSVAVDSVTKAAVASGNVHAVSGVYSIRGDYMQRDEDGMFHFHSPMCATTCTNAIGHTHWNVTGDLQYRDRDFVLIRNAWLRFYEIPVLYLPYLYYPIDYHCGFSWMPGYLGRWGAFLMTQYRYHLLGDREHSENTFWVKGVSRMDIRYRNGVALGQDFKWNLGDFGHGKFDSYYAWDRDADDRYNKRAPGDYKYQNWGSAVEEERYILGLKHIWDPTERDHVFVRGTYLSDSYFRNDFLRISKWHDRTCSCGKNQCNKFEIHDMKLLISSSFRPRSCPDPPAGRAFHGRSHSRSRFRWRGRWPAWSRGTGA